MHRDQGVYTLTGIAFPASDGPGLGTPVFQDDQRTGIFIQDYTERRREEISGFIRVDESVQLFITKHLSNSNFAVSDPLQYGMRTSSGNIFSGNRKQLSIFAERNRDEILVSPFLSFHLSQVVGDGELMLQSIKHAAVKNALMNGIINFPRRDKMTKSSGWSDLNVEILIIMWGAGASASQIGRLVGATRNAVIGKVHRLGLSNRADQDQ
jgi:hypothetical protein